MKTTLLIARHGNTFGPGETPTRVGARTDLPLVESGKAQGKALGKYLLDQDLVPDLILTSELQRTKHMAELAMEEMGRPIETHALPMFNEIDYGPDENKPEAEVIARIGEQALKNWDEKSILPQGWLADPGQIIINWQDFANELEDGSTTLVITSNGIARFALTLISGFESDRGPLSHKISTGALCILERNGANWTVRDWNIKP